MCLWWQCWLGALLAALAALWLFATRRPRALCFGDAAVKPGRQDLGDRSVVLRQENAEPPVLVGEGFVTPEEAQELIRDFEGLLARSTVYREDGGNETESSRTSSTAYLPPGEPDTLVERLERRAAALLGVPVDHLETLQLLRYEPSQKYDAHWDFFRTGPDAANNRTKTALVYLNDLETGDAGGSTRFPKLNLEVKPALGRVVVWHNCAAEPGKAAAAKDCDDRTLHAGEPPERSVKYAINIWARNLPTR